MALVDWEIFRTAINLPCAGMHDRNAGIDLAASFEQLQLRRAVDREIDFRRGHRVEMARLRREIKQEIPPLEQMPQTVATADIGNIDGHPIVNVGDIGEVAAIFGDHAVDKQNVSAEGDEPPCDGRADQAQTAGNYRAGAGINFKPSLRPWAHLSLVNPPVETTTRRAFQLFRSAQQTHYARRRIKKQQRYDDIKLGIIGIARGCRQRGPSRREQHQLRYRSYEGACEGHLRKAGGAAAGGRVIQGDRGTRN